jgi:hypothetical protein
MSLVEISPGTFITDKCYTRLIEAAEHAKTIKLGECVKAVDCTDEQLIEFLNKEPRPTIDITGLSRERLRLVLFGVES